MRMHFLDGGRVRMRRSIFYPGAPRDELFDMPVGCTLMRHPQGNVLFDTGCHPGTATDAAARWGGLAKLMQPIHSADENVVAQLACTGLAPHDIDLVVCSHLHPDHCGCNAFFPKATLLCHRDEIAAARVENAAASGYIATEWDGLMPLDVLDSDRDVFGDSKIVLRHMPGHTPGMLNAVVTLERSGVFVLASDSVSVIASLDGHYAPKNTWNAEKLLATLAEIEKMRADGATVIGGHDAAQWSALRRGAEYYE